MQLANQTFDIIDLTHPLNSESPNWFDTPAFSKETLSSYGDDGYLELSYHFFFAGVGTHMDAPSHFHHKGHDIASIPLQQLMGPAHVIHLSEKTSPDYLVTIEDIKKHERAFGEISEKDIVLIHTGWSKYWKDSKKYLNKNLSGKKIFPTLDRLAGEYLGEKNIKGLGIDTLSPDLEDSGFPVHKCLLSKNIYLLENLTHLDQLPPVGALIFALPPKIEGGTEANLRVIALLPK